jgi:hypothetical protein
MKDPLDEALGLPPLEHAVRLPIVPEATTDDVDYEHTRKNIYRALGKIEDAMDELAQVARVSQHPRAYEVYANLAKTFLDANKELIDTRKRAQDSTRGPGGGEARVVNNNLVITSTDMLRAVKDAIRSQVAKEIDE